jgi:hypothetical protein
MLFYTLVEYCVISGFCREVDEYFAGRGITQKDNYLLVRNLPVRLTDKVVVLIRRQEIITMRCVISEKSADFKFNILTPVLQH